MASEFDTCKRGSSFSRDGAVSLAEQKHDLRTLLIKQVHAESDSGADMADLVPLREGNADTIGGFHGAGDWRSRLFDEQSDSISFDSRFVHMRYSSMGVRLPSLAQLELDIYKSLESRTIDAEKVVQMANTAQLLDLFYIQNVLKRKYIQSDLIEAHEFSAAFVSMSRCFCQDVVQFILKFYVLAKIGANGFIITAMVLTFVQAMSVCLYNVVDELDFEDMFSVD